MKSTTTRGTPYNFIGQAGSEGIAPGTPAGMVGTVHKQFDSDRRGYRSDPRGGTPYESDPGNAGDARNVVHHDRYGRVIDPAAGDQSDPAANGSGTVFDGPRRANGYTTQPAPSLDSAVPRDASSFDPYFIPEANAERLGHPESEGAHDDSLVHGGGVMSRD
jgi:hypothetical protein